MLCPRFCGTAFRDRQNAKTSAPCCARRVVLGAPGGHEISGFWQAKRRQTPLAQLFFLRGSVCDSSKRTSSERPAFGFWFFCRRKRTEALLLLQKMNLTK